jgi:formimidoylglutamate deiminase
MSVTMLHAASALTPAGWRTDVRVEMEDGRFRTVTPGVAAAPGDERVPILVPCLPNVHSHAFQRAMAGLAEHRGPTADTFWTWRETMYRFALGMNPAAVEAVAALLYVEMLEAGFSRVGEFHYLHHDLDGRPYANIGEMAERIAAAAAQTGVRLTLLPVLYRWSTFGGAPPNPGQRRFISTLDQFARLVEASGKAVASLPDAVVGVAPHSLRAVTPEDLAAAQALAVGGPVHIHVAEQVREVEDCLAWSGARPVQWLFDHAPVDARWCLIHATHMTADETHRVAASRAVAGLCPVTEANLGDGIFPTRAFAEQGGRWGIGTDSNVRVGVAEELRQLEYAQRLAVRERNVLARPEGSTGRALLESALAGGAQALGAGEAGIAQGAVADCLSLDLASPDMVGREGDAALDTWVFVAGSRAVDRVWIGGRKCVDGGRHVARESIAARYTQTLRTLLSQ